MDRDALFMDNWGLVGMVLKRLGIYPDDSMYEDFQQIGYIGLFKAAQKFKPELGFRFSTYAVPMIEGEIRRERRDNSHTLKISRKIRDAHYRYKQLEERGYDDDEICEIFDIGLEKLNEIRTPYKPLAYLDAPHHSKHKNDNGDKVVLLGDSIPSGFDLEEECISKADWEQNLRSLTETERKCIELRSAEMTQEQIAKRMGMSQGWVSRTLIKAKEKLSKFLGGAA